MLDYKIHGEVTIICDKCDKSENCKHILWNEQFYKSGWRVKSKGRKWKHLCADCLATKKKQSIREPFYGSNPPKGWSSGL